MRSDVPRSYPPGFRRKVLNLLTADGSVADLVRDLQISDQTIYTWRRRS
ncbi:transposase [Micromonospora haikouensis]